MFTGAVAEIWRTRGRTGGSKSRTGVSKTQNLGSRTGFHTNLVLALDLSDSDFRASRFCFSNPPVLLFEPPGSAFRTPRFCPRFAEKLPQRQRTTRAPKALAVVGRDAWFWIDGSKPAIQQVRGGVGAARNSPLLPLIRKRLAVQLPPRACPQSGTYPTVFIRGVSYP